MFQVNFLKKKAILFFLFVLTTTFALSNVAPMSEAIVSELYFDENGDWTIELYFRYFVPDDTEYVMITSTDTAFFMKIPDSTNYVLLTNEDLSKDIYIDKIGEKIKFENWFYGIVFPLTDPFVFGNFPGSGVCSPYPGQSLVYKSGQVVKDTSSSLGFQRTPPKGILRGHVYDSVGNPIPYLQIQTQGMGNNTIWPDENGFFSDTLYAKNYSLFVVNDGNRYRIYDSSFAIEPDSTSMLDIFLPLESEIEFSGYCFLGNNDYHSNTVIYLKSQCPFASLDSIVTDSTGYYSKMIPIGHYRLRYSHQGFLPQFTYSYVDIFFDYQSSDIYLQEGIVHEITGKLPSGRWEADYPYWIFDDVYLDKNDTLIIDPGTQIIIKRFLKWDVYGTLLAEGTEEDSIVIQPGLYTNWGSFTFWETGSDMSKLKFVDMSFQENLNFQNSNATIENSLITWNGDICFFGSSSPLIKGCRIEQGIRLYCYDNSSPILFENTISAQIRCEAQSQPTIVKNILMGYIPCLCLGQSAPLILNNDFYNYWVAIQCTNSANPKTIGNIFQKGGYCFDKTHGQAPTTVKYNIMFDTDLVWTYTEGIPGLGILDTTNINGDSCDIYFNLFTNPLLSEPEHGDYTLLFGSPCIDAGDPEFLFDPDSTIADIGALYFDQTNVFIWNRKKPLSDIKLFHYPNPASSFINFVIEGEELSGLDDIKICLYNLLGNKMAEINCPFIEKGFGKKVYSLNINGNNLFKSGIFVYTLEANGKILSSKKLTLVK